MAKKLRDVLAEWWVTNARIRHGHPADGAAIDAAAGVAKTGFKLGTVIAAAGAGGLVPTLAMWALSSWLGGGAAAPPAAPDLAPPFVAPADPGREQQGSLYQFLEDHDLHLPEGE